ncbi:MAG: hypothetical protein ACRDHM_02715 [Actinomycetota bacterium]
MRGIRFWVSLPAALAVLAPFTTQPAFAADTAVTVSGAAVGTTSISVTGTIAYGTDATDPVVLGTDASGDAAAPGMDLTGISVRPNIAGKQLIWNLATGNGLPDPVGGPAPALTAYMVPIMVDGDERWRWLGAGTTGTAFGNTEKWTGLCHNEVSEGTAGGWSCPGTLAGANTFSYTGSITQTGVSWTQPFAQMKPTIKYGSVVEPSSILCARPCSFLFPPGFALGGLHQVDTIDLMEAYKVPGEVKLAIAPLGVVPPTSAFSTGATFTGNTGAFSGSVARPAAAGEYTVWARTCFGKAEALTCALGSSNVTV